jgi:hypothetical protein
MEMNSVGLRKVMETDATSMNKHLREAVKTMDWIILLRHVHPNYRSGYASDLLRLKEITKEEASEFVKFY